MSARPLPPPIDKPLEIRRFALPRHIKTEHAGKRPGKRAVFAETAFVGDDAGVEDGADGLSRAFA